MGVGFGEMFGVEKGERRKGYCVRYVKKGPSVG